MTPRHRQIMRDAKDSLARRWVDTLMPLLLSISTIMGGLALRQSGQAKNDSETAKDTSQMAADAAAGAVQVASRGAQDHQADHKRIARLEADVAYLKALAGRASAQREEKQRGAAPSQTPAQPATLGSIITAPARWFAGLFQGGTK